jgi:hypothetical protein
MKKRLVFTCLVLALLHVPDEARAQFTGAHNYDNTPVGTNQVELAYTYARSDVSIDTGLVIAGAKFNLNAGTIDYSRYFGLANHLMWVNGAVPIAGLSGSVTGTNIRGSINGAADSSFQVAVLLKGGPALRVADFDNYKPETIVGVSFSVAAPSGQYNGNKILILVPIAGCSGRRSRCHIRLGLSKSGSSTPTPTASSTRTTSRTAEPRS